MSERIYKPFNREEREFIFDIASRASALVMTYSALSCVEDRLNIEKIGGMASKLIHARIVTFSGGLMLYCIIYPRMDTIDKMRDFSLYASVFRLCSGIGFASLYSVKAAQMHNVDKHLYLQMSRSYYHIGLYSAGFWSLIHYLCLMKE